MIAVLAFLKAYWKPIAVVVALVAAFGAGRFATPSKVHVVSVVSYKVTTVQGKTETKFKDRVKFVDRVVTETTNPDGTKVKTTTDKSKVTTATASNKNETNATSVESSAKTEKITIADHPRFTVSLLGGYQLDARVNLIPGAGGWSVGLAFQYRVAGPLQVGVFGLSTGVFGLSLGLSF